MSATSSPRRWPERPSLITVDLSFISAGQSAAGAGRGGGGKRRVPAADQAAVRTGARTRWARGGIVREPELQERAIERVRAAAEACGLRVLGVQPSRVPGAEGNQEFFLHAAQGAVRASSPGAKR